MDRNAKQEMIGEIRDQFANVMSVVLADYRGLDVPTVTAMREEFRKAGCSYRVLKNTLVKIAIAGTDLEPMATYLKGPTALMWSHESPSAPAKIAIKWAKEKKSFEIKGGFFDGQLLDAQGVDALANMPGKPELQATLLMTFIAAPTDFVRLIAAAPQNFVYLIDARRRALGG